MLSLIEFIYLKDDQDPIFNIVGENLSEAECSKLISERPIVYLGKRQVVSKIYKTVPTLELRKYAKTNRANWLSEVNVGNFLTTEKLVYRSLVDSHEELIRQKKLLDIWFPKVNKLDKENYNCRLRGYSRSNYNYKQFLDYLEQVRNTIKVYEQ